MKSYVILKLLRSGFGTKTAFLNTPLYTAILLIGLIGKTFPEAFTQSATTPFAVRGELGLIRESLNQESSPIPESMVSTSLSPTEVPIQIFLPLLKSPVPTFHVQLL